MLDAPIYNQAIPSAFQTLTAEQLRYIKSRARKGKQTHYYKVIARHPDTWKPYWVGVFTSKWKAYRFWYSLQEGYISPLVRELPRPAWKPGLGEDIELEYKFVEQDILTSGAGSDQTYNVPADWNNSDNLVECIGAGGGGSRPALQTSGGSGGGGGAYAATADLTLTPGGTASYRIGASGTGASSTNTSGVDGGDTWFNGNAIAFAITLGATGTATASGSIATVAGLSIGPANTERIVVACISWEANSTITGVTIGGVSATQRATAIDTVPATDVGAEIWVAKVPTGTTASVVVTYNAGNPDTDVTTYYLYGAVEAPTDSDTATGSAATIALSALTVPAGGGAIFCFTNATDTTAVTWTGASEGTDIDAGAFRHSTAHTLTAGTNTITADGATADQALCGIAFTPGGIASIGAQGGRGGTGSAGAGGLDSVGGGTTKNAGGNGGSFNGAGNAAAGGGGGSAGPSGIGKAGGNGGTEVGNATGGGGGGGGSNGGSSSPGSNGTNGGIGVGGAGGAGGNGTGGTGSGAGGTVSTGTGGTGTAGAGGGGGGGQTGGTHGGVGGPGGEDTAFDGSTGCGGGGGGGSGGGGNFGNNGGAGGNGADYGGGGGGGGSNNVSTGASGNGGNGGQGIIVLTYTPAAAGRQFRAFILG